MKVPPTYKSLPTDVSARMLAELKPGKLTPPPRADQKRPSHCAIRPTFTPLAFVKLPAAYNLLPIAQRSFTAKLPVPVSPPPTEDQVLPSQRAIRLTATPLAFVKFPPA